MGGLFKNSAMIKVQEYTMSDELLTNFLADLKQLCFTGKDGHQQIKR